MRTRKLGALSATALVLAGLAAGCGSGDDYANADRPPAPVSISIAVTQTRVQVAPSRIGAGPVLLLIANESGRSHDVTLTAAGGRSCVTDDASSGPINPQAAARMQLSLVGGTCEVGVAGGELPPARLVVGPERPTAQQDLLQP